MLKFILIFFLFFWIVFKLGGFFMRVFLGKVANDARQNHAGQSQYQQHRQPADGNVHIDYIPKKEAGKNKKGGDFRGGDYVDYEEV